MSRDNTLDGDMNVWKDRRELKCRVDRGGGGLHGRGGGGTAWGRGTTLCCQHIEHKRTGQAWGQQEQCKPTSGHTYYYCMYIVHLPT